MCVYVMWVCAKQRMPRSVHVQPTPTAHETTLPVKKINHLLRVQTPSKMSMMSIVLVGTAVGRGRVALQGCVGVVCVDAGASFSMPGLVPELHIYTPLTSTVPHRTTHKTCTIHIYTHLPCLVAVANRNGGVGRS